MKYDVFIGYSSKDQKVVEGLSRYLKHHKNDFLLAYYDRKKVQVWARTIVETLTENRRTINNRTLQY